MVSKGVTTFLLLQSKYVFHDKEQLIKHWWVTYKNFWILKKEAGDEEVKKVHFPSPFLHFRGLNWFRKGSIGAHLPLP